MLIDTIGLAVALPGTVALAIYLATDRLFRLQEKRPPWTGAVATGVGYTVGHLSVAGWQSWLPIEASQWLVYLAGAATILSLSDIRLWTKKWIRRGLRLLFSLAIPMLLLMPMWKQSWDPGPFVLWMSLLGLGIFLFWTTQETLTKKIQNLSTSLVLLILTAGTSITLAMTGSLRLGQLGGVLTATLGAGLLMTMVKPTPTLQKTSVDVVSVILPALWIIGWFYSEMPTASLIALALSPAILWTLQGQVQKLSKPLWIASADAAAAILSTVVAIIIALQSTPETYPY